MTANSPELLRKSWEIDDHWMLRRDFMIAHKDKFPPDRLLCLAQAFVNIETLGVGYPDDVVLQIKQLEAEVPSLSQFRQKKLQLQSEERFKAPPKSQRNDNLGTRNVTHDRYQNYQQNYSQRREDNNQYQQLHGYGRNIQTQQQQQSYPRPAYGQGYNSHPVHQQQQGWHGNSQQASYQPQHVYQPAYGRNSANSASSNPYQPQAGYQQQSQYRQQQQQQQYQTPVYGQRQQQGQAYGRNDGWNNNRSSNQSNQTGGQSTAYSSLLNRGQRRNY